MGRSRNVLNPHKEFRGLNIYFPSLSRRRFAAARPRHREAAAKQEGEISVETCELLLEL